MLPPMKQSSTKAIQWSMLVMAAENRTAQQPADGRHQALESAEVEPSQQIMPEVLFPAGQTLADGYGKGIHGKPHRNEKQLNQTHILLPLSYQIRSLHCMSGQLPDRTGLPFCGSCAVMRLPDQAAELTLPGQTQALLPSASPSPMVQQTHAGYYTMEQSEMV